MHIDDAASSFHLMVGDDETYIVLANLVLQRLRCHLSERYCIPLESARLTAAEMADNSIEQVRSLPHIKNPVRYGPGNAIFDI